MGSRDSLSVGDRRVVNDTTPTEIYPLSLHDALPISICNGDRVGATVIQDTLQRQCADKLIIGPAQLGAVGSSDACGGEKGGWYGSWKWGGGGDGICVEV